MTDIEFGKCQCGCNLPVSLARDNDISKGYKKGQPVKYVRGHHNRKVVDLFDPEEDGCWDWRGTINMKGYGVFSGREAHRIVYELLVDEIPDGMQIDHLCRNTSCVNPGHLEVVTPAENTRRGKTAKLTRENVIFIRNTEVGSRALAEMFGVTQGHINFIRAGHVWKDVA